MLQWCYHDATMMLGVQIFGSFWQKWLLIHVYLENGFNRHQFWFLFFWKKPIWTSQGSRIRTKVPKIGPKEPKVTKFSSWNFFGCMLVDHHDLFSPSTKCSFDPFIIFSSHSLFLLSSTFVSWIKNRVGWFDWEIRIADQRIKCNDTPALVFKST